jgi:hypothetical protein
MNPTRAIGRMARTPGNGPDREAITGADSSSPACRACDSPTAAITSRHTRQRRGATHQPGKGTTTMFTNRTISRACGPALAACAAAATLAGLAGPALAHAGTAPPRPGVLAASPALAGRGHKWELLHAAPFTLRAAFCGFNVKVVPVAAKEYQKVLKASDGSLIFLITGTLKVSFTNVHTGTTITENVSGPGKLTVFPDGSAGFAGKGHTGPLTLAPADAKRFGLPAVSVTTGALTISFDANGHITSLSLRGHVLVNVCAALS